MNKLPDVQNTASEIQIAINRVGIMDLQLPISILQQVEGYQSTVATFSCFVDLAAHLKGINMSRLPATIHKYIDNRMSSAILADMAEDVRVISNASVCELEMCFPYFIKKLSPIRKEPGWVPYDITFNMVKTKDEAEFTFIVGVTATSLCPCSKEMSGVNAHNQKCLIQISCTPTAWLWIEDIIKIAEASASGEIYSVLKRPDEQHVTNQMYDNPAFVEDIARSIYSQLIQYDILKSFKIRVESDESIHKHKAVAIIETS